MNTTVDIYEIQVHKFVSGPHILCSFHLSFVIGDVSKKEKICSFMFQLKYTFEVILIVLVGISSFVENVLVYVPSECLIVNNDNNHDFFFYFSSTFPCKTC